MNRSEAKELLSLYRPGVDDDDPMFADALALAERDPEVKRWLAESVAFDAAVAAEVRQMALPPGLRDAIVVEHKIVRPAVPFWQRRLSAPQFAAAAAIMILGLASAAGWYVNRPTQFAKFRQEIIQESWGSQPHLKVATSDLSEVKRFLAANNAPADFDLPPALDELSLQGCSLVEWRGQHVPFLCFSQEGKHFHLVVADRTLFRDAPARPELDHWEAWRVATWSKNTHTFMTTGLSPSAFLKIFRKPGRWDWEG